MSEAHGRGFVELAEGCFIARYAAWDVTIGAVIGSDGVLVVDTRATAPQGTELSDDLRRVAPHTPVRWVVNTHQHFDHVLGNTAFAGALIHAHENAAAGLVAAVERVRRQIADDPTPDPAHPEITAGVLDDVLTSGIRLPDVTFNSVWAIDLGGRYVELAHPGRGHTDGDIVVSVPGSGLLFAGDLIEESADPSYGEDCFPLDWSPSLDLVVGMMADSWLAVPGHGAAVDREFVKDQRAAVSDVGELIRSLHAQGVPLDRALDAGGADWPYPAPWLATGVRRGYEQLAAVGAGRRPAQPPAGSSPLPLA